MTTQTHDIKFNSKNLTGFFLCNYKIFLVQAQANAQAKLDKLGDYAVTYHPPFSEDLERCKDWKGVEKVEWGNPATYRKPKPRSLSKVLSPLQTVMRMREYYEN